MPFIKPRQRRAKYLADGGQFWQQVGGAFTDPEKRFEFPVKPFEYTFTKESMNALYMTAGIFAAGIITAALIVKSKN